MSVKLREIKQRITSTRQIHKVTDTLQRIAAAHLAESRRVTEISEKYTERLTLVVQDVLFSLGDIPPHPLAMHGRSASPVALIVFGADRGLYGGYNSRLMDRVKAFMAEQPSDNVRLFVLGKTTDRRSRKRGYQIVQNLSQPSLHNRFTVLNGIVQDITRSFLGGEFREILVLYMKFVSGFEQVPTIERVLPVSIDMRSSAKSSFRNASFESAPRDMLSRLLPEYVQQIIDHAFLNSISSENAARQIAMNRAAENADEVLTEQTKIYRRLRQENITTEMMEIAGGRIN
ncbi:MAG: F0F1 ATP synthase subunit gamma [Lentisphaerae bacterium]|nr:F0F1 ATP synthase subunit gamma [Lentisphaerota bacterium]